MTTPTLILLALVLFPFAFILPYLIDPVLLVLMLTDYAIRDLVDFPRHLQFVEDAIHILASPTAKIVIANNAAQLDVGEDLVS
jgi:hypothetical protein